MTRTLPGSKHFRLQALAEGVYAAIVVPGTGAWGNAGIIDLGDRTLVFDTFFTPRAALDLRAAAEQLTGRPAAWVVNSHWHADHVYGNQVFADATLIATAQTRATLAQRGDGVVRSLRTQPDLLQAMAAAAAAEGEEARHREALAELADHQVLAASLDTWHLRLPHLTFAAALTLHGSRRRAEVLSYGGGHTDGDALLWLPDDGIAFLGDLVQVGFHLFLRDADPAAWMYSLDRITALGPAQVVPGHGPVAGPEAPATTRAYLADMQRRARAFRAAGGTPEQAGALPVPPEYAGWGASRVFGLNMCELCRRG